MDGDGSIQVNHWRQKNLQFRMVIKLKYTQLNINMLYLLTSVPYIKGTVRIDKKKEFVVWVVDEKNQIKFIVKNIFEIYPPLTSRLHLQLQFLIFCLNLAPEVGTPTDRGIMETYFTERQRKFINQQEYIESQGSKPPITSDSSDHYFSPWLSGFIEAEGCFTLRTNSSKNCSFIIAQNNDNYLLERIRNYFNIVAKVRKNKKLYILETYRKSTLLEIINHFEKYPLLGEKLISYEKFKHHIN